MTLLEANLALTPAQRLRELVAMNKLHDQLQSRTLTPAQRAAINTPKLELKFGALVHEPLKHVPARATAD